MDGGTLKLHDFWRVDEPAKMHVASRGLLPRNVRVLLADHNTDPKKLHGVAVGHRLGKCAPLISQEVRRTDGCVLFDLCSLDPPLSPDLVPCPVCIDTDLWAMRVCGTNHLSLNSQGTMCPRCIPTTPIDCFVMFLLS